MDWHKHLAVQVVDIIDGPVARSGGQGPVTSLYIHDSDGNLLEISNLLGGLNSVAKIGQKRLDGGACDHDYIASIWVNYVQPTGNGCHFSSPSRQS